MRLGVHPGDEPVGAWQGLAEHGGDWYGSAVTRRLSSALPTTLIALALMGCGPTLVVSPEAAQKLEEALDRTPKILSERLLLVLASVPPEWRTDGDAPELFRWGYGALTPIDTENRVVGYLAGFEHVPTMLVVCSQDDGARFWALIADDEAPSADWPVVHVSYLEESEIVAANLRDFLAEALASYDPPDEWTRAGQYRDWVAHAWLILRLGQDDPEERADRLIEAQAQYEDLKPR